MDTPPADRPPSPGISSVAPLPIFPDLPLVPLEADEILNAPTPDPSPRRGGLLSLLAEEPRAVVLGVPGGGKTALLTRMAAEDTRDSRWVPLGDYRGPGDLDALVIRSAPAGFGPAGHPAPADELLFDGLDECPPALRAGCRRELAELLAEQSDRPMVITARAAADVTGLGLPIFVVRPLVTANQLRLLATRLGDPAAARDLLDRLRRHAGGDQWCGNPLTLLLAADLAAAGEPPPTSRPDLLRRWLLWATQRAPGADPDDPARLGRLAARALDDGCLRLDRETAWSTLTGLCPHPEASLARLLGGPALRADRHGGVWFRHSVFAVTLAAMELQRRPGGPGAAPSGSRLWTDSRVLAASWAEESTPPPPPAARPAGRTPPTPPPPTPPVESPPDDEPLPIAARLDSLLRVLSALVNDAGRPASASRRRLLSRLPLSDETRRDLGDWLPGAADGPRLRQLQAALTQALRPGRPAAGRGVSTLLRDLSGPGWDRLRRMAEQALQPAGPDRLTPASRTEPAADPAAHPAPPPPTLQREPAETAPTPPPPPADPTVDSVPAPPWWKAWEKLVPRWRRDARTGRRSAGLDVVIGTFQEQGWEPGRLADWAPDRDQGHLLDRATDLMGRLICPNSPDPQGTWADLTDCLTGLGPAGRRVTGLARAFVRGRRPGLLPVATEPGGRSAEPRPTPTDRWELAVDRPGAFTVTSGVATVYIDEVEVGTDHGAVAGLVWDGHEPSDRSLPRVGIHVRDPRRLHPLLACPRAFPFVMPLRSEAGQGPADYLELVKAALQVLLGWLLARPHRLTQVRVNLERYGQFEAGADQTLYFQGAFDETAARWPGRFEGWRIEQVCWVNKEFEYIQWGDLLGYWYLEAGVRRRRTLPIHPTDLPGYVPLSVGLVNRLKDLDHIEGHGAVGEVLAAADELAGTRLGEAVVDELSHRLADRLDLQQRLLRELDLRQQSPDAHPAAWRRQWAAVQRIVPDPGDRGPVMTRLLWTALRLQAAVSSADPASAATTLTAYQELRELGMQVDRELVARIDLQLAAGQAARLECEPVRRSLVRLVEDRFFEALRPATQGRVWQSLGQCEAQMGRAVSAGGHFRRARHLFDTDPGLTARQQAAARLRVDCHHATNALRGGLPFAAAAIEAALDGPPADRAAILATDASPNGPLFQHQLLMYCLWAEPGGSAARRAYLAVRPHWAAGDDRPPWPLINLFRGVLLTEAGSPPGLAGAWFERSVAAVEPLPPANPHRLVGIAAGAAAACCLGAAPPGPNLQARAGELAAAAAVALPAAQDRLAVWHDVLENPSRARLPEVLDALPPYWGD